MHLTIGLSIATATLIGVKFVKILLANDDSKLGILHITRLLVSVLTSLLLWSSGECKLSSFSGIPTTMTILH